MNPRNRFFILLSIIFVIALGYYFFSTPSNKDLVSDRHGGLEPGDRQPADAGTLAETCWWTKARP